MMIYRKIQSYERFNLTEESSKRFQKNLKKGVEIFEGIARKTCKQLQKIKIKR